MVEAIAEDTARRRRSSRALGERAGRGRRSLATTTSSLSVAELARGSGRPERFVGLHVFNPVTKMKLVELSFPAAGQRGHHACELHALCDALGKTAGRGPDTPGFVVNRLLFPYLFDAVRLLERDRPRPQGGRHVHEARRRPPDGAAGAARLRRASTWRRRSASRSAPTSPSASRTLIAEGALGRKTGPGLLHWYDAALSRSSDFGLSELETSLRYFLSDVTLIAAPPPSTPRRPARSPRGPRRRSR